MYYEEAGLRRALSDHHRQSTRVVSGERALPGRGAANVHYINTYLSLHTIHININTTIYIYIYIERERYCIHIHIHLSLSIYTYIYIYMYRERERYARVISGQRTLPGARAARRESETAARKYM